MNESMLVIILALLSILAVGGCSSNGSVQLEENATYEEIVDVAVKMKDARICSRFSDIKPVTLVSENITVVENLDMGCIFEGSCISAVALSTRDINLCKKVKECGDSEDFARNLCINRIEIEKVQDVAMTGDYRNCVHLKGTLEVLFGDEVERKELCLNYVAINQTDYNVCEMIEKASGLRDTCLFSVTVLENPMNSEICKKIRSEEIRLICQQYEQSKESP